MAETQYQQYVLSEEKNGSLEIEDELASLSGITALVGHQLKEGNERMYLISMTVE